MLLLLLEHYTFEEWFIRLFLLGLLPQGFFRVDDLRVEYLQSCWKEEELWKKWSENVQG